MPKPAYTALGWRVDNFIQTTSGGPDADIGLLLLKILTDEKTALKFGLLEAKRGRPRRTTVDHGHIAAEYLMELHRLGGRNERGAATEATRIICERHGIDHRVLRRYVQCNRQHAYILYRLAVLDGIDGLTGAPDVPEDVEIEIRRIVGELRR